MMRITRKNNDLWATVLIAATVAVLIHFPEMMMLSDHSGLSHLFPGMRWVDVGNEIFFTFISLLLLFAINTYLIRRYLGSFGREWPLIIFSFMITWGLSNLLAKVFVFLHQQFDIPAINAMIHHYLHPMRDFVITLIVTGSCYIGHLIQKKQSVEVENQQLRAENLLNQYETLKNQLNPHMLFNSLNTLRSLIRETPEKAQDYLQELSHVLRYMLQSNDVQSVTLYEEMQFVKAYVFLLKMRYEENLMFDICLEDKWQEWHLPPMGIQLLVENAVKHNEISHRRPLTVQIRTEEGQVRVENKVQPKLTTERGTHIGLANLSKRYQLLYRKEIAVREEEGCFCVILPLVKHPFIN
ncbi:MAG: histidine kinase [Bacteroidales bacterium]